MGICKSHCYYEPKVDNFKEIGERDWVLGVKKESVDPKRATPVIYIVFYYLDVGFEDKNVYNIDMLITNGIRDTFFAMLNKDFDSVCDRLEEKYSKG